MKYKRNNKVPTLISDGKLATKVLKSWIRPLLILIIRKSLPILKTLKIVALKLIQPSLRPIRPNVTIIKSNLFQLSDQYAFTPNPIIFKTASKVKNITKIKLKKPNIFSMF